MFWGGGGGPTLLGKGDQLHLLISPVKNLLPVVAWVTEVVNLYNEHLLSHCVSILALLGGSKWEQMRPPRQTRNVGWVLV
jgi:hypothetical protein